MGGLCRLLFITDGKGVLRGKKGAEMWIWRQKAAWRGFSGGAVGLADAAIGFGWRRQGGELMLTRREGERKVKCAIKTGMSVKHG